jgi:hypothetical protein
MGDELNMEEMSTDNWLDRRLREAAPYIDDNGFTRRVLASLPAPKPRREWLRTIILIGITLLGSALAYVLSGGGRFITVEMLRLASLPALWIFVLALGTGFLTMAGGLVAAVAKTSHDRF